MSATTLAPKPAEQQECPPDLAWTAANIAGHVRGIASALDDLANVADFKGDDEGWLMEVLIQALEREADRLEEMEADIRLLPTSVTA